MIGSVVSLHSFSCTVPHSKENFALIMFYFYLSFEQTQKKGLGRVDAIVNTCKRNNYV